MSAGEAATPFGGIGTWERSSEARRRPQPRKAKGESHDQQERHDQRTAVQRGDCEPPATARTDAAEDAVRYQVVECWHGERRQKDQANARIARREYRAPP